MNTHFFHSFSTSDTTYLRFSIHIDHQLLCFKGVRVRGVATRRRSTIKSLWAPEGSLALLWRFSRESDGGVQE